MAHCGLVLHTLDVNLVMVEEGVHGVGNLEIATALLLEALLGQQAEVLGCPVGRWSRTSIGSSLLLLGCWDDKLVAVAAGDPDGGARRFVVH